MVAADVLIAAATEKEHDEIMSDGMCRGGEC